MNKSLPGREEEERKLSGWKKMSKATGIGRVTEQSKLIERFWECDWRVRRVSNYAKP